MTAGTAVRSPGRRVGGSRRTRLAWYVARRLLVAIPLLFGLTILTFALVRLGDVNPAILIAGPQASQQEIQAIETDLGLDKPMVEQYFVYLQNLTSGDMGTSWVSGRPVTEEIKNRLPPSLELIVFGVFGALLVGVLAGVLPDQLRKGSIARPIAQRFVDVATVLIMAVPVFWAALLLLYVLWFELQVFPSPSGRLPFDVSPPANDITGSYFVDGLLRGDLAFAGAALAQLALPVLVIIVSESGVIARHVRSVTREVRSSNFYRYARATGSNNRELLRLVVRNSASSIVSFFGIVFAASLGGVALVELVFAWGGLGDYGLKSMQRADFAMVQGFVLVSGVFVTLVYIITDTLAVWLDPKALP